MNEHGNAIRISVTLLRLVALPACLLFALASCGQRIGDDDDDDGWVPAYFVMRDSEKAVVEYLAERGFVGSQEFEDNYRVTMWGRVMPDGARVIYFMAYDTRSMTFEEAESGLWEGENGARVPTYPGVFNIGGFGGFPVIIKATVLPTIKGYEVISLSENRI